LLSEEANNHPKTVHYQIFKAFCFPQELLILFSIFIFLKPWYFCLILLGNKWEGSKELDVEQV